MTPAECEVRAKKGVFCDDECGRCGFNPAVKKRRLKQGYFRHIEIVHTLHGDNRKPIHTERHMCKQLIFKKGDANV